MKLHLTVTKTKFGDVLQFDLMRDDGVEGEEVGVSFPPVEESPIGQMCGVV